MSMVQLAKLEVFQTVYESAVARLKSREPLVVVHNVVTVFGLLAICVLALMFFKPVVANGFASISPFEDSKPDEDSKPESYVLTEEEQLSRLIVGPLGAADKRLVAYQPSKHSRAQQKTWVIKWLSRRFHVAPKAIDMIVSTAYETADEMRLDPLLILAVISIESRFNPVAQSPVGAQGLMQVMTKVHREKFEGHGGDIAALNPIVNIKVGSRILKEYVRRDGTVPLALKRYVGAANLETDDGYGAKVLGEYAKLRAVASGKRVRAIAVAKKPKPKKAESLEQVSKISERPASAVEADNLIAVLEAESDFE